MKGNSEKRGFSIKDALIILLCVLALVVLVLILKKSQETEQQEQQQLNNMQNHMQESEDGTNEAGNKADATVTIVINEVNQAGWVEVYNNGKTTVSLASAVLYVNGEKICTFPSDAELKSEELYVLETGKLLGLKENNVISLCDAELNKIHTLLVPKLTTGESYGFVENGSAEMAYQIASRGEDNDEESMLQKNELTFSVPGGFYSNTINLEINVPEGTQVYYTLDGSDPTKESSQYQSAIKLENRSGSNYSYASIVNNGYKPSRISMGTVVRAIAVDESGDTVGECTQSYYIGIANNSDLAGLPVISLTTDADNLFDYFEGIYVPGKSYEESVALGVANAYDANYLQDWKKDAYIEFFESNKDKSYAGRVSLTVLRDYSMSTPQKGFQAIGEEAGAFKGSTLYKYFNDISNTLKIQANKRDNDSKAREYLINELLAETEVGTADLIPCILFINGEYWGGYTLRAPMDESYFERHYGISDEHVILAKDGIVDEYDYRSTYEDLLTYVLNTDMSVAANYEQVKSMMDIQSYLDYVCTNVYLANADYGIEEAYAWKTATVGEGEYADGRWRWIVGKLDNTADTTSSQSKATKTMNSYLFQEVREDILLRSLIHNAEFEQQLKDTMNHMANQVFEYNKVSKELALITAKIEKMASASYDRFFGSASTNFYANQVNRILAFFNERGEYILRYTNNLEEIKQLWEEYTPYAELTLIDDIGGEEDADTTEE